jgi:hypothetical protein
MLKIFILSTIRYIEIDGGNGRHKYKSTTSPAQYVLLIVRVKAARKVVCKKYENNKYDTRGK